jgi:hypothetical protein
VLDQLGPDCILLEGPPDAQDILSLAGHEQMKPPVAILIHVADDPSQAVYYPFARFSPEWITIGWGLRNNIPVRFFDLPHSHRFPAVQKKEAVAADSPAAETGDVSRDAPNNLRRDPLGELARAAGFDDGERWWEHIVEHRRNAENDPHADLSMFVAIREAMSALREKDDVPREKDNVQPVEDVPQVEDEAPREKGVPRENDNAQRDDDILREAWMRRSMREAEKEGNQSIAVICGAFHAPALVDLASHKKADDALLKGLAKVKTIATWVPWTYDLLTAASGYGAGVRSPGWYDHVFAADSLLLERWMTRIARLLREQDLDCSSAHVIESVRLAHALAAMRARPIPDLSDIADAARSVFCHDSDAPLRLIGKTLLIGDLLGEVPDDAPQVPLQRDLARQQKTLRLKPEALEKSVEFDLRNETDMARSRLLHRLRLIGIDWGVPRATASRVKGTFAEFWQLRWDPHFAVSLIQAARFGNSVEDAAAGAVRDQLAQPRQDLAAMAAMLDALLLADLPDALDSLLHRIDSAAAVASDVGILMDMLPPLARAARYGTVRQTDVGLLAHTIAGVLPRIIAGLPPAVGNISDDLAAAFTRRIAQTDEAIALVGDKVSAADDWFNVLNRLHASTGTHGQVQGKSTRLLFDRARLDLQDVTRVMSLALSKAASPSAAAAWLQGFLEHSGLVLVHDPKLLGTIDTWVAQIPNETFDAILPLLRRTFATFAPAERRQIGSHLASGRATSAKAIENTPQIDEERGRRVLPILRLILGAQR